MTKRLWRTLDRYFPRAVTPAAKSRMIDDTVELFIMPLPSKRFDTTSERADYISMHVAEVNVGIYPERRSPEELEQRDEWDVAIEAMSRRIEQTTPASATPASATPASATPASATPASATPASTGLVHAIEPLTPAAMPVVSMHTDSQRRFPVFDLWKRTQHVPDRAPGKHFATERGRHFAMAREGLMA